MLLQGDPPSPANPPPGCRFHTRCPLAQPVCREERPPLTPRDGGRGHAMGGVPLPLNSTLFVTRTRMSTTPTYDLLIRGGTVIDGTKAPRFDADVAVKDGRIAAVGDLAGASAARTIDAAGLIVAPGFIDSHTHDDQALLSQPDMDFKVSQGVTTVIAGNCGISAAPLVRGMKLPMPLDLIDGPDGERHETFASWVAALRGHAGGDQRRRAGRPFDAARRDHGRPRPRGRRRGDRGDAGAAGGGARRRRDRPVDRHLLSAGAEGEHGRDHRGRPAADGARRPLRHPHARRVVEGDGGARRDLPHRPRARHPGGGLASQGAEPAELRPLRGDARPSSARR